MSKSNFIKKSKQELMQLNIVSFLKRGHLLEQGHSLGLIRYMKVMRSCLIQRGEPTSQPHANNG